MNTKSSPLPRPRRQRYRNENYPYHCIENRFIDTDSKKTKLGITPAHVIGCVCRFFNVKEADLKLPDRHAHLCRARVFIWHFLFVFCPMPLTVAAKALGRTHGTVYGSVEKLRWEADHVRRTGEMVKEVERKIKAEWDRMP